MKNVYILMKEYYNNVSVVEQVFSSEKRAREHLEYILKSADEDGWSVVKEAVWRGSPMEGVQSFTITATRGRRESLERFYILKELVA